MVKRFEDLDIWKKAFKLSIEIYKLFSNCRDFGFKDQITRSALSIPSNISEGFERNSKKEFIHFLHFSKGSSGESRTQLYIAVELGYIDKEKGLELIKQAVEISAMIAGLIKKIKSFLL